MVIGYNVDIKIDNKVYHIQTEDLGRNNPHILTLIYLSGAIIHSQKTDYSKKLGPNPTDNQIQELMRQQHTQLVLVESNAYQGALLEWMGETLDPLPLKAYITGSQKMNPSLGLPTLAVEMERGLWHIPLGDQEHLAGCTCGLCLWLGEMAEYPLGQHDDLVMACFLAREAARLGIQEKGKIVVGGEKRKF